MPIGSRQRRNKLRLAWVYSDQYRSAASTIMRGDQLAAIAGAHLNCSAEVSVVGGRDIHDLSDSIVILTKGFLKRAKPAELRRVKEKGNIICADYVDDPPRDAIHEVIDVYIASSIRQYIHYSKSYDAKIVQLITHHVDTRIKDVSGPEEFCNIGYFGELVNALHASELQGAIDFCPVDTKYSRPDWIPKLQHYNVHYAVRRRQAQDQFKPFLKGFTAAWCHSNIVVSRQEGDAVYYLSSDYPYMLKDESLDSVLRMLDHVRSSFGSAEWHRGLDIMKSVRARIGPVQIGREIEALIARCR